MLYGRQFLHTLMAFYFIGVCLVHSWNRLGARGSEYIWKQLLTNKTCFVNTSHSFLCPQGTILRYLTVSLRPHRIESWFLTWSLTRESTPALLLTISCLGFLLLHHALTSWNYIPNKLVTDKSCLRASGSGTIGTRSDP